ncbi:hypothetical protein TNIN_464211 [Trichonephila inaurata madagascariensis]|uniref:Uncharacterized protein n=1 Tax=Trichonephila inaurata madagascariensis TaxID=2747483 RepID=A0A8X6XT28_9ARAC|nr:hypothetical protein TNIN_464211 [Trichonephila inaurata madagascariensis]
MVSIDEPRKFLCSDSQSAINISYNSIMHESGAFFDDPVYLAVLTYLFYLETCLKSVNGKEGKQDYLNETRFKNFSPILSGNVKVKASLGDDLVS